MTAFFCVLTAGVVSCSGDTIDQGLTLENLPQGTLLTTMASLNKYPSYYPVPGGSGIITITQVTASFISISWVAASDDVTPYTSLQYKVVVSQLNNIVTPAAAEYYGTTVINWTSNLTKASATSLTNGTTYYLNVLVRDLDGFISAYSVVSAATL